MRFFHYFESLGVLTLLILVIVVASLIANGFFTYTNITNTIIIASIAAVTGFGMTFAIAMGGFDLSVGSVQAFTAITAAALMQVTSMPLAILGALAVGLCFGLINGVLITRLRVPAFVATFGMMSVIRGVALLVTKGQSVMITGHTAFAAINNGKLIGIPVPFLIVVVVFVLLYFLLRHTPFGRHVCAIGGNRRAAVASGIHRSHDAAGVRPGRADGCHLRRDAERAASDSGRHTRHGFELQTIAISVLGGTSLAGGSGTSWGR